MACTRSESRLGERSWRLQQAIRSLDFTHGKAAVFFYMTIDLIMIAFARPLAMRISMAEDESLSFQTVDDLSRMRASAKPITISPSGAALRIQLFNPMSADEGDEADRQRLESAHQLVSRICSWLEDEPKPTLRNRSLAWTFCDGFREVLRDSARQDDEADEVGPGVAAWASDDILKGFFSELEQLFSHQDYNINFEVPDDEHGQTRACPRLLFSYYYVNEDRETDLRLHLLENQRFTMRSRHPERAGRESASTFAERDGQNALLYRLFPDLKSAASSGIATWLESRLGTRGLPWRALVLPIHVQGLPWLVMTVLFKPDEAISADDAMREEWAQHFYIHFFPQVIATVRQLADDHYLNEVEELARRVLKDEGPDPRVLQLALAPLTATFPYSDLELRPGPGPGRHPSINWQGYLIHCHYRPNRGHGKDRQWVPYRTLEIHRIPEALKTAQRLYESEERGKDQSHGGAYFNFSHTIKNLIISTGWEDAIRKVAPISDYCFADPAWHLDGQIRGSVLTALDYADRALSLSLLVEGFGYFGRVLGLKREDVDFSKFADWLPEPGDSTEAEDKVVERYAQSIFHFAQAICFGRKWMDLEVRWDAADGALIWRNDQRIPFNKKRLHFPPFLPGADAVYPFIFALAEPLQNAINALKLFPAGQQSSLTKPLQITLKKNRSHQGGVVVTISNLCLRQANRSLSGLDDAARMLAPLGLVAFGTPSFKSEGRLYRATIDVELNPGELARRIREKLA